MSDEKSFFSATVSLKVDGIHNSFMRERRGGKEREREREDGDELNTSYKSPALFLVNTNLTESQSETLLPA